MITKNEKLMIIFQKGDFGSKAFKKLSKSYFLLNHNNHFVKVSNIEFIFQILIFKFHFSI